jgi:hypothetical protein
MNGGNDEDIEQVLSMFDFTANSIHWFERNDLWNATRSDVLFHNFSSIQSMATDMMYDDLNAVISWWKSVECVLATTVVFDDIDDWVSS